MVIYALQCYGSAQSFTQHTFGEAVLFKIAPETAKRNAWVIWKWTANKKLIYYTALMAIIISQVVVIV